MRSIETREGQAESHYRVAVDLYDTALKLFTEGPDRILSHANPELRSARPQIIDCITQAKNNLQYAKDFGLPEINDIGELENKIAELTKQLQKSK